MFKWEINLKGEIVIPPDYYNISGMKNGVAIITTELKFENDSFISERYGVINMHNELLLDTVYEKVEIKKEGILATKNGNLKMYDFNGKKIFPNYFDGFYFSEYSRLVHVSDNGKKGIYDVSGNMIIPIDYDEIGYNNMCHGFELNLNGKWGVSDKKGNICLPVKYDEVKLMRTYDWQYEVRKGKKWKVKNLEKWMGGVMWIETVRFVYGSFFANVIIEWVDGRYDVYY